MTPPRPLTLLVLLLVTLGGLSLAPAQTTRPATQPATQPAAESRADLPTFDLWYAMLLGGQRAGHSHMTATIEGDKYITTGDTLISIRRGPAKLDIGQTYRFEENLDGKPLRATSAMDQGGVIIERDLRFGKTLTLTTRRLDAAGKVLSENTRDIPAIEGEWSTPGQLAREWERALAGGEKEVEARTLDIAMGVEPFTLKATRAPDAGDEVEAFGKAVPATAWDVELSNLPNMTVRQWLDEEGQPVKTTLPLMPGMEIEMLLADRATATADIEAPEVMAAMLLKPAEGSVIIEKPRTSKMAVYTVTFGGEAEGEGGGEAGGGADKANLPKLPRAGYQRVVWGDEHTAKVVVDLTSPVNPDDDLPGEEHLASSTMIDFKGERIGDLLPRAIGPKDPMPKPEAAARLRAFVADYVNAKDLSVGMATASEVARTRQGDCTEHAVLLTALLRKAGIPARTVTGVVYADEFLGQRGIFGFHMWTQAWLDGEGEGQGKGGRWVDLDPSLPADGPDFDATHIALGTSAMSDDDATNDLIRMLPLMQKLTIKVEAMR